MPTIGFEIKRKCKVCGKVFVAKTLDSYYCSPKCGKVAWKRKKDVKDRNAKLEAIAQPLSLNQIGTYSSHQFGYKAHAYQTLRNGTTFPKETGKYCRKRKTCS